MAETREYNLQQFCDELEALIGEEKELSTFLLEARALLEKLLPNHTFVNQVLEKMISDSTYAKGRIGTIDRHDILLHRSPSGSFTVRLFVWTPNSWHPIHDHGSWGVVGSLSNDIEEIEYRRLDDGSIEGYAKIEEKTRLLLTPGKTCSVLPFDQGIHWTGSANKDTALSVHVYGKPLRQGFVRCFDVENNSTYLLITPKLEKRLYAIRALEALGDEWAKSLLESALQDPHPLVRWQSIATLEKIDKDLWIYSLEKAMEDQSDEVRSRARVTLERINLAKNNIPTLHPKVSVIETTSFSHVKTTINWASP
ncbi:MAG: HEAT repeat domain-containing protein [Chloroflexota bacterium]|nr:HEAT repeat domain-containing protein [Chloroflexota bacterium]